MPWVGVQNGGPFKWFSFGWFPFDASHKDAPEKGTRIYKYGCIFLSGYARLGGFKGELAGKHRKPYSWVP